MSGKIAFKDLGLSKELLDAVSQKGFEEPTEIQALTIPILLKGETNIIAQAHTGTGKTAAFALPLIDLIDPNTNSVQALILVPTRELAIQVSEEITSLRGQKGIRIVPIYGGQSIDQQLRRLTKGVHIVVGTPGRVIDHLKRGTLKLEMVSHLVLDEADEMLNMGFIEDIEKIMEYTKSNKRTLLFSATMPQRIKDLAQKYLKNYEHIKVKHESLTTSLTEQIYFEVKASEKFEALCRIIDYSENFYGLIFCRTKSDADTLTSSLLDRGYDADAIHSDISQNQREKTLDRFRKCAINILVATDVAARGIDITNLSHVINFSLPYDAESYVHRIGRTGRAGNEGTAVTFITPSEYRHLMKIQKFAGRNIEKRDIPKIEDIIKTKKKRVFKEIKKLIDDKNIEEFYTNWALKMLKDTPPSDLVSGLLAYCFGDEFKTDTYSELKSESLKGGENVDISGKSRLFIALGKKDGFTPKKLVNLITEHAHIPERHIREVQIMDRFAFMTVPFDNAEEIINVFKTRGRNKKPLITMAKN